MSNEIQQLAQEAADKLLGSCDLTPDAVFETDGFAEALDEIVGCCNTCGWWVETSDLNDDYDCTDCAEEN